MCLSVQQFKIVVFKTYASRKYNDIIESNVNMYVCMWSQEHIENKKKYGLKIGPSP